MTTYLIVWTLTLHGVGTLYFRTADDCQQYVQNDQPAHILHGCHKAGPVTLRNFTGVPGPRGGGGDLSGQSASG
jgi:hypothetical protein